ncbi:hypothetical protein ACFPVT_08065 [Corynebacterium choanae]|uniref:Uncharacterized protein n=1 Tax=Corynebacterium choanae TaxID=1862358 RepID=A0A3G6JAV6_9CORY|nr:hypothetical protein [Corynebacterium choanae]AZA14068.1 hypothetical protein CCHOA_08395 [Corynebacterium choanae]
MRLNSAVLRHRELTQEIGDIGDEVATYIDHIAQAVADYDEELVDDTVAEFGEILAEAAHDSRPAIVELIGLRRALLSGSRMTEVTIPRRRPGLGEKPAPVVLDAAALQQQFPLPTTITHADLVAEQLQGRTAAVISVLEHTAEWVYDQAAVASIDPEAVFFPTMLATANTAVEQAVRCWLATVAAPHPRFCRAMRGSQPPLFLHERARVDAVIARVRAKMAATSGGLVS